jgi:N-methylhydantoinase B
MAPMMSFACLKSLLDPEGAINAGAISPITVELPPGSYLNARRPAACSGMAEATFSVATALLGALAAMLPDRAVGDLKGAGNNFYIGGTHAESGDPFLLYEFAAGGSGAVRGGDGNNGCRHFLEGDFGSIQPVEVVENECPVLVERSELRTDSGGPGTWRGGLGLDRQIRFLSDNASLSYIGDKIQIPPFGVAGAQSSAPNAFGVVRDDRVFDPAPVSGKVTGFPLRSNDIAFSKSAGGGGYGDPLDRAAEQVVLDVAYGYVSKRRARDDYGVVVECRSSDGLQLPEEWEVDHDATRALRKRLRNERRKSVLVPATKPTDVGGRRLCFACPTLLREINVTAGDPIEILNPVGAPLRLWIEIDDLPNWTVAVDTLSLRVLGAKFGDRRLLRRLRDAGA